jgi:putative membrane protein
MSQTSTSVSASAPTLSRTSAYAPKTTASIAQATAIAKLAYIRSREGIGTDILTGYGARVVLLIRFVGNVAAIWVAAELLDGVSYGDEWQTLLLTALVLTIANWLVKPILTLLALPVIVLTLGIALFFVSLAMLLLTEWLVDGFRIDGFWAAVGATIIVWAVNAAVQAIAPRGDERRLRRG